MIKNYLETIQHQQATINLVADSESDRSQLTDIRQRLEKRYSEQECAHVVIGLAFAIYDYMVNSHIPTFEAVVNAAEGAETFARERKNYFKL